MTITPPMKLRLSLFVSLCLAVAVCTVVPTVQAKTSSKTKVAPKTPPANKVDALMNSYDLNHDGKLDKQEMKAFLAADPADAKAALAFDRDHDGVLFPEEISAWREASGKKP